MLPKTFSNIDRDISIRTAAERVVEMADEALGAMKGRVMRFAELQQHPVSLMFIDSILPGHQRLNYAVIGDTASENPDFTPAISDPHSFQIGMVKATAGNGPAYHTHDYVEAFVPLTAHKWRFYWGESADKVDGETILNQWDLISLPPKLWRGFEVLPDQEGEAWIFAVLEQHTVFEGKDPYWAPQITRQAAEYGFHADDFGRMIKPENYQELEQQMLEKLGHHS
jgi:hypothetical protein